MIVKDSYVAEDGVKIIHYEREESDPEFVEVYDALYTCGHRLLISFNDGKQHEVDFEPFLRRMPVYQDYLDDLEHFKDFEIINGNVNWHDYHMIFPPEDLYEGNI